MTACPTILRRQLTGIATAGVDCVPRSFQMAVEGQTGRKPSVHEIRTAMANPTGPSTLSQAVKAAKALSAAYGFTWEKTAGGSFANVRGWLREGAAVVLFGNYGPIVDRPRIAGSRTYRKGHAVMLCGLWREGGRWKTNAHDPLCDGRKVAGYRYPQGPQVTRVKPWKLMAGGFAGVDGKVFALAIFAKPAETDALTIARLEAQIVALHAARAADAKAGANELAGVKADVDEALVLNERIAALAASQKLKLKEARE